MSSTLSLYFRDRVIRAIFIPTSYTTPQIWLALTRKVPEANAASAQLDEPPSGTGYARVRYDPGAIRWDETGYGEVSNSQEIEFAEATNSWGQIVGWAFCDAAIGGNVLAVGSLTRPQKIGSGAIVTVPEGAINIGIFDT